MIKSVEIENFKKIKKMALREMKTVNVISGKNSSGKTTVLESVFVLLARLSPDNFIRLMNWRGENNIQINTDSVLRPLFHNYDLNSTISIKIKEQLKTRELNLKFNPNGIAPQLPQNVNFQSNYIQTSSNDNMMKGEMLEMQYIEDSKQPHNHKLVLGSNNAVFNNDRNDQERLIAGFISTQVRPNNDETANFYDDIKINKDENDIIEAVQIIEPKVKDIITQGNRVLFDVGLDSYKPLALFGDGVARLLYLIVSIVARKKGLLMIDEIERGFHYSIHDKVWETLIKMAIKHECQLIITTHSYEILQSLVVVSEEVDSNEIAYYRIENGSKSERYSIRELNKSISKNWEVR